MAHALASGIVSAVVLPFETNGAIDWPTFDRYMRTEIKRLHQRLRTTVIYVTHDQIEAMTMATQIAVMREGEVVQFGSPSEIYDRPANMFVARFVGSPPMNFLRGRFHAENGQSTFDLNNGERPKEPELIIPLGPSRTLASEWIGREMALGVRPESIAVDHGSGEAAGPARWTFVKTVDVIEPTGADTLAILDVQGAEAIARVRAKEIAQAGQSVRFSIAYEAFHFFDLETEKRFEFEPAIAPGRGDRATTGGIAGAVAS